MVTMVRHQAKLSSQTPMGMEIFANHAATPLTRLRMVAEEYISGRILALQSRPELEDMQFIMSQIVFTAWSTDPARLKMQPSLRATASMLSKGGDADDLTPLLSQLCSGLEDAHKLGAVSAEIGAQLRSTRILEPGAAETRELHRQMVIIGSIVAMMTDAARLPAEDANAWGQLSELYSGMAAGSGSGSGNGKPAEDHTRLLRRMVAPLLTNALRISNGSIAGDPACESTAKAMAALGSVVGHHKHGCTGFDRAVAAVLRYIAAAAAQPQVLQQAEKLIPGAAAAVAQSMLRGDAKNDFHDEVLSQVVHPILLSTLSGAADADLPWAPATACLQSAIAACDLLAAISDADLARLGSGDRLLWAAATAAKRLAHVAAPGQKEAAQKEGAQKEAPTDEVMQDEAVQAAEPPQHGHAQNGSSSKADEGDISGGDGSEHTANGGSADADAGGSTDTPDSSSGEAARGFNNAADGSGSAAGGGSGAADAAPSDGVAAHDDTAAIDDAIAKVDAAAQDAADTEMAADWLRLLDRKSQAQLEAEKQEAANRQAAAGEALAAVLSALSRLTAERTSLPTGVPKACLAAVHALLPRLQQLPERLVIELADSSRLLDVVMQQVTPESAALLANRASAAAEQCLGQAAPSAAAWSALAACTAVLEAACARGRLDLDDATSLRLHMEVPLSALVCCTTADQLAATGVTPPDPQRLLAAMAAAAGLLARSATQLLNANTADSLAVDPAEWLGQQNALRLLTSCLALLSADPPMPPEQQPGRPGRKPGGQTTAQRRSPHGSAGEPEVKEQNAAEQQLQELKRHQAEAALQRRADHQQRSLQAVVHALCAALSWAEAAWSAEGRAAPSANMVNELASAAIAIVGVAQQQEAQLLQAQQAERAALKQRASQHHRGAHKQSPNKQSTATRTGGTLAASGKAAASSEPRRNSRPSNEPAPLATHLRAAATAVESLACLAEVQPDVGTLQRLAAAAPAAVTMLKLLLDSADAAALPAAAQLLPHACAALAAFAQVDASARSLLAPDGVADWQSTAQLLRIRMLADNQPNVDALDKLAAALAMASSGSQNGSTALPGVKSKQALKRAAYKARKAAQAQAQAEQTQE